MPTTPKKVCVLSRSKREAIAWGRQNGVQGRHIVHATTANRVHGVYFLKIVELPSFKQVRARHAILKALKRNEGRRFLKIKPEWVYDTEFEIEKPAEQPETGILYGRMTGESLSHPAPESPIVLEPPVQTDIFEQIDLHEYREAARETARMLAEVTDIDLDLLVDPEAGEGDEPRTREPASDDSSSPEAPDADAIEPSSEAGADQEAAPQATPEPASAVPPKPKPPKRPPAKTTVAKQPSLEDLLA